MRRTLRVDVCNYLNEAVCNIYDSQTDVSGAAVDVFINKERNGWKELTFNIPSVCMTEIGLEENFRLQYLVAEYRLRTVETINGEEETDWYVISEPSVHHEAGAKNVSVTAGHISQTLKTKKMNLEFSDEEGNNVGTCEELLTEILDGTNWHVGYVAKFFEDNGVDIKTRTLVEPLGSNAFKMISDLCDLFDAKPTYNGDYTVDIGPMNPFSVEIIPVDDGYGYGKKIRLEDGQIPALVGDNVVEFHYDREAKGITRTLNTDNLVTRLYAYGSYGDYATGICDLKEINHDEYIYTLPAGSSGEQCLIIDGGAKRYFIIDEEIQTACTLIYSMLDIASKAYVWNETTQRAYLLYDYKQNEETVPELSSSEIQSVTNNVDFLLNFSYYLEVGLLTDEMIQEIAQYQRELPALNAQAVEASAQLSDQLTSLSNIGQDNTGFLKLKVKRYTNDSNNLRIEIDTTENDGIIYRSDYVEKFPFAWHTAKNLKDNGDPTSGSPSMVWILHQTEPITFEQAYLKKIDERTEEITDFYGVKRTQYADYTYGISEGRPEKITLWSNYNDMISRLNPETDSVYLFCTNGATGSLGAAFSSDEAAKFALETELKTATLKHPVFFEDIRVGNGLKTLPSSSLDTIVSNPDGYAWAYLYNPDVEIQDGNIDLIQPGKLFFCYHKDGDQQWRSVYCGTDQPAASTYYYFYQTKNAMLYRSNGSAWTLLDPETSAEYKRIGQAFAVVWKYCMRRDEIYKGKHEYYVWTNTGSALTPGNYAFANPYGFYWTFTTDRNITKNHNLRVHVASNNVFQDEDPSQAFDENGNYLGDTNSIVETQAVQLDAIDFPTSNIMSSSMFKTGVINSQTGVDENEASDNYVRTTSIQIHDNTTYESNLPSGSYCVIYDINNNYMSSHVLGGNTTVDMPNQAGYIRIVAPKSILSNKVLRSQYYVRVQDYQNTLFVDRIRYRILSPVIGQGTNKGINNLIKLYPEYADTAYQVYLPQLQEAQAQIKAREQQFADIMQDTLRDSRWQDANYVDGDEDRLYADALDNSFEIGKPEATYDIDFLSLYESQGLTEDDEFPWPDVDITSAAHLVDPEIDINLWGYLDRVNKCYDQDWKTNLELNTKLSTIQQHSFTDIMSYVADVANQAKNKQSVYERAASLSATGKLLADKLDGTIKANVNLISGAAANWYTNEKGQMVFESENGLYAMMLSGAGLMIANSKTPEGEWNWRTSMTGAGMTADTIVFGEMSGQRIQAHTITADKVAANLGNELEIGSNVALTLYATKDGYRPAGSLDTQDSVIPKVASDESFIQILPAGKDGSGNAIPARIYIMSGGLTHIEGGTMEMISNSNFDISSGSDMNISSGGSLHINVSGKSGNTGTFSVNASNFQITEEGNLIVKGNINVLDGGNIAGVRIKDLYDNGKKHGTAMFIIGGVDSLTSTATTGAYIGTDGMNIAGKMIVSQDGATVKFGSTKVLIDAVSGNIDLSGAAVNVKADSTVAVTSGKKLTFTTGGTVIIGNNASPFTVGSDGTGTSSRAYIYNGKTSKNDTSHAGIYLGTDGIIVGKNLVNGVGGYFQALPDGTVKMTGEITASGGKIANWTISTNRLYSGSGSTYVGLDSGTSGVDYAIWAGNATPGSANFRVTRAGAVTLGSATILGGSITIKSGKTTNFNVSSDGTLTAIKGTIANWTLGSNYLGSGSTKGGSQVGIASGSGSNVVFWAGHTVTSTDMTVSTFYVTASGYLYSTSGRMGGWYIGSDYIGNASTRATSTVGMYSGTGTSFWAGGTTAAGPVFSVTNSGYMTTTSAKIGNWTLSGGTLSRTVENTGTVTLGGDYAINVNGKFTVGYDGYMTSTYGEIAGWTISDSYLYKAVPNRGNIYLGSNDYAIAVNSTFLVDWDGNTHIKSLNVNGESINFDELNFDSAITMSGSWDGDKFKVTAKLFKNDNLSSSTSMNAGIVVKGAVMHEGSSNEGHGTGTVSIALTINGKEKEYTGVDCPEFWAVPAYLEGRNSVNIQSTRTVRYTSNGTHTVYPGEGYDAMSKVSVVVNVSSGGGSTCFPAGSQVMLADGTTMPIEKLNPGMVVTSYDEQTRQFAESEVQSIRMFKHANDIYDIALSTGEVLTLTGTHPVLTKNGWKCITNNEVAQTEHPSIELSTLTEEDIVLTAHGESSINKIVFRADLEDSNVFNIDVEDIDTYIVENVIVHNSDNKN